MRCWLSEGSNSVTDDWSFSVATTPLLLLASTLPLCKSNKAIVIRYYFSSLVTAGPQSLLNSQYNVQEEICVIVQVIILI